MIDWFWIAFMFVILVGAIISVIGKTDEPFVVSVILAGLMGLAKFALLLG